MSNPKKRKITNQLRDGIVSDTTMIENIVPITGALNLSCPSRDNKTTYAISFFINDDHEMKFTCNCSGNVGNIESGHCIHLNSAMIRLCKHFINSGVNFLEYKDQYELLNGKIDEIDILMNDMHMQTE